MITSFRDDLRELFQTATLTLATTGPSAEPYAAPIYFVAVLMDDPWPQIYFFSDSKSQHCQNLALNPRAAAACYPECSDWQEIRGLQVRGEARQVPRGLRWDAAWEHYQIKFPFVKTLKAVVARNSLYEFQPTWTRLVDNRRGFGFKQEWAQT